MVEARPGVAKSPQRQADVSRASADGSPPHRELSPPCWHGRRRGARGPDVIDGTSSSTSTRQNYPGPITDLNTLDHLIYGAPRLDDAAHELEMRLGVRPAGGGRHLGLGTRNTLLGLGPGRYLEIIAPDPDQPSPSTDRPFGLDGLERPQLVGWALRCSPIETKVLQACERGYDPGEPVEMQRTTPTGVTLHWRLTLNAVEGGLIPFLIDWGGSEHPSASAPTGLDLLSFHLQHPSPAEPKRILEALGANVEVIKGPRPGLSATIGGPSGHMTLP